MKNIITICNFNFISSIRKGNSTLDELATRFVLDGNVHAISCKWYDIDDYAYGVVIRKISGKYYATKWNHEYRGSDLVIAQSTRCMSNEKAIIRLINNLNLESSMIRVIGKNNKDVHWKIVFPKADWGTLPEYFQKVRAFIPPRVPTDNAEKRASLLAKIRKLPEPPEEIEV